MATAYETLTEEAKQTVLAYIGTQVAKSMDAAQDSNLAHVSHAMGCKVCAQIHAFCDRRMDKLSRKNKKLRKRLANVDKRG